MNFDLKFLEGECLAINGKISLWLERLHSVRMSFDVSKLWKGVNSKFPSGSEPTHILCPEAFPFVCPSHRRYNIFSRGLRGISGGASE